jgi:hypothetical protein
MMLARWVVVIGSLVLLQGQGPKGSVPIQPLPPSAVNMRSILAPRLGRDTTYFVTKEGRREATYDIATPDEARSAAKAYLATRGVTSRSDIDALAFLILVQAASATRSDLQAISRELSQITAQKEHLRNLAYSDQQSDMSLSSSALLIAMDRSSKKLEMLNNELARPSAIDKSALKNLK